SSRCKNRNAFHLGFRSWSLQFLSNTAHLVANGHEDVKHVAHLHRGVTIKLWTVEINDPVVDRIFRLPAGKVPSLNRSCAEVCSVIPAVIAGYRAFQQFAPEPFPERWPVSL